jgi:inner membrane protein
MRRGIGFASALAALYGLLYVLLRSEDHALLMGALLVFVCLAAAMVTTRKVDWYGIGADAAFPSGTVAHKSA